jgi:zinc protease
MPFILFTILFVCSSLFAQAPKNLNEHIPLNPKVKVGKLDNGMTYYIMENKRPENRVEARIKFLFGSLQEEDHQVGLAHFIEHMCFNGTKNFPKESLVQFLESTGVKFGADLNAMTGFDAITYMLTLPLDVPNMLETGIQVLDDWARYVTFDSIEIEKERGVIIEEDRQALANAQGRLMRYHFPKMLNYSRYVDRHPIGDMEIVRTAPRQAFLDYYYDWFRPELTGVIVVGDINVDEVEALIKKQFSD